VTPVRKNTRVCFVSPNIAYAITGCSARSSRASHAGSVPAKISRPVMTGTVVMLRPTLSKA
jgi:hypothetical protein